MCLLSVRNAGSKVRVLKAAEWIHRIRAHEGLATKHAINDDVGRYPWRIVEMIWMPEGDHY